MANETLAREQRDYILAVLERTGKDMTNLARDAGLDHSTLSRFLTGGREGHVLRHTSIRAIERVTGYIFQPGLPGAPTVRPVQPLGFSEAEATPLRRDDAVFSNAFISGALGTANNMDAWVLRSRALEGIGCRPGDVLIVALGETPRAGDIVCAQIYDWPKGIAETVFRLYQPPCLVAVSADDKLLRPYIVDGGAVTIKGVVAHTIRSRAAA